MMQNTLSTQTTYLTTGSGDDSNSGSSESESDSDRNSDLPSSSEDEGSNANFRHKSSTKVKKRKIVAKGTSSKKRKQSDSVGNAQAPHPPKKAPKHTPKSNPTVPSASFPVSNSSRSHSATPSTASASKLSEYEKTRNSNIKHNRLLLAAIDTQQRQSMLDQGLDPDATVPAKATKKPAKRKPSMPVGKSAPWKSPRQLKMVREKGREKGPEVVMSEKDRDTSMHSDKLNDIEARTAGAVRDDENDVDMGGDTEEEMIVANTIALGSFTTPQPDVLPIATLTSSPTPQPNAPPIATLTSSPMPQPDVPPIATLTSSPTPQPNVLPVTAPVTTPEQPDVSSVANSTTSIQLNTASVTNLNSSQSASIGKWLQKPLEEITKSTLMMPIPIWFPYSATWSMHTPLSTRLGTFLKSRRSVQHNSLIGFMTLVVVGHRQLSWTYPSSQKCGETGGQLCNPLGAVARLSWCKEIMMGWTGSHGMLGPVACLYWWGCAVLDKDGGCIKVNRDIKE